MIATILTCALALTFAAAYQTPTAPSPRESPSYYPTTIGTKWVLTSKRSAITYTVLSSKSTNRGQTVEVLREIDTLGHKTKNVEKILVTTKAIAILGIDKKTFDPPQIMMKLPNRAGERWTWQPKESNDVESKYTSGPEEDIVVPAGSFKAVRVDRIDAGYGITVRSTSWFARGKGVVKRQYEIENGSISDTYVLKSFSVPRQ